MANKYFAKRDIKTSSKYTEKIKNVEMLKSAKTSTTPTINYTLQGKVFEQFRGIVRLRRRKGSRRFFW
jgi:hypothetical protein